MDNSKKNNFNRNKNDISYLRNGKSYKGNQNSRNSNKESSNSPGNHDMWFLLRIIGGRPARSGKWPWQVLLLNRHKVNLKELFYWFYFYSTYF